MYDSPSPPKPIYFHFSFASIIKLPPNPGENVAYKDLICTKQDETFIVELITSIAENSKFSLLLKQSHFRNIGVQINHVHPLKFLAISSGTPYLKACLVNIFDDYFKRNAFMEGLIPNLVRESEKGKLDAYLPSFAAEVGIPAEQIKPYFQARDWEGFLRLLMEP